MYTFKKKDQQGILNIKVSKEEWEKAVEAVYQQNKSKFKVEGFRAGKAPRRVIEQHYGDQIFFEDAFDAVVNEAYSNFLAENKKIVPASHPHADIKSFTVDAGLEAVLKFDLMPEFELPELSSLTAKKGKAVVSDEQVDAEFEASRGAHARYVEEEKTAENGDFATIDFVGTVDGVKFDGGEAKDYRLELGSHTFIDGFEDQVVGMNKGEEKDVNVVFPANYPAENLAGKPAVFHVTLNKVEKKVLPEIDDKFISDTTEFETVDEFKKSIKENLVKMAEERVERDYEVALLDEIADKANITLGESMIEHELYHMVEDFEHRLSHQGMTLEGYLQYIGKTADEFKAERKPDAEKNIKTRLVLQRLISENKITVTEDELNKEIADYAGKYQMNVDDFKKAMSQNDYAYFQNNVIMTKVLNLVKSKANKQ
ncbi:MAG: trigger factor [Clostridia bacterium]|nr:trigger factor [Clostridia bacterium]MBQ8792985.1 trigger factor [Clostridia bacterium]